MSHLPNGLVVVRGQDGAADVEPLGDGQQGIVLTLGKDGDRDGDRQVSVVFSAEQADELVQALHRAKVEEEPEAHPKARLQRVLSPAISTAAGRGRSGSSRRKAR